MNRIINQPQAAKLGTILAIWAHPDDETFCAGGLMAAAAANGQKVICVTATRGEAGSQDSEKWPLQEMGKIRTHELQAALKILGVTKHHFLGYTDGQCKQADPAKASREIAEFITKYKPDSILTFGSEGLTGHPDHQAVSSWVDLAVQSGPEVPVYHAVLTVGQYRKYLSAADDKLNFFYNIKQPPLVPASECDICFCCNDDLCDCKYDAFAAMPSQYEKVQATFDEQYLKEAFRIEAFVLAT